MKIKHSFVKYIPDNLEKNTLYISKEFETATHLCFCGCGEKVVTPLGEGGWKFVFDNEKVSLDPSIGNFQYKCKSHYWVSKGEVIWT